MSLPPATVRLVANGTSSVEALYEELRIERQAMRNDFDALDSKAGVVLGFAGALGALAPVGRNIIVELGRGAAVLGVLLALWAFWPRDYQVLDFLALRSRYLAASPQRTRLDLFDTHTAIVARTRAEIAQKSNRARLAMVSLALAAVLVAVGTGLH